MFEVHSSLQIVLVNASKTPSLAKLQFLYKKNRPCLELHLTWRWSKCTECVMPPYLFTTTLVMGTAGPPVNVKGIVTDAPYAGEALLSPPSSGLH